MRPSLKVIVTVLAAGWALAACDGHPLAPTPALLDGTWATLGEVPGSSEIWSLAAQGTDITGTGTWSGEACCAGTLAIVGTIRGDSVHLDLTFSATVSAQPRADFHKHFDGVLESLSVLRGMASFDDGASGIQRLQKQ